MTTSQQPTLEIFGESIAEWDKFYEANYDWIHKLCMEHCLNYKEAAVLTNKIFMRILLANPESVIRHNHNALLAEMEQLFPDLKPSLEKSRKILSRRLMERYYSHN